MASENPSPGRISKAESPLRYYLRIILFAWVFGSFWLWIVNGAAMTRFARGMGTPDWAFGLLAMTPPLAGILQLPASIMLERLGRRKTIFLTCLTLSRLAWVIMAAIPWVLPDHRHLWWPLMLLMVFLSWSSNSLGGPAYMNWMAHVIPASMRGRYFGLRNRLGQVTGIVTTLAVGVVMDQIDRIGRMTEIDMNWLMLATTSALIALAGLVGILDIQVFTRVPDDQAPAGRKNINWGKFILQPFLDTSFRWFLLFNFMLWLGIGALGQYLWLYLFDVVKVSNRSANAMLIAIPLIGFALAFPIWGRMIDRVGCRPVLVIASMISSLGGIGWLFVQPDLIWPGYLLVFFSLLAWPGVESANFNMLLGLAGSSKGGGAYVACNAAAVGAGGIISGIGAGFLAGQFVESRWQLPVLNIVVTYHSIIFILSFVLRFSAIFFALKIHEPRAHPTQEVVRYMSTTLHSNLRSMVMLPNKIVNQMVRRAYRDS